VRQAGRSVSVAAMMGDTEHEALTFLDFAREHRVKIHRTNVLERLDAEIKRRANVASASSPTRRRSGAWSARCC